jgi:uncharacterized protein DUF6916
MSNRRELLKLGAMAGVAAVLPGRAGAARPALSNGPLPATGMDTATDTLQPTRDQLTSRLNSTFLVQRDGEAAVPIVLVGVADPAPTGTPLRGGLPLQADPLRFRATFRGSTHAPLGQKTYQVAAKGLDDFDLFLVPVGPPQGKHRYYEAAFNRSQPD